MPKFPPKCGSQWDGTDWGSGKDTKNWGVLTNFLGDDGRPVYAPNGSLLKKKVRMRDGKMSNGTPQCFYFPDDHELAGVFKGMAIILKERGHSIIGSNGKELRAECAGFKCEKGARRCCCRRMLFNEPDFVAKESLLEAVCKARSFRAIFFPKFHCELNFIEQCWGYSKRIYWQFPASSTEADLEKNVTAALDSIPIESMRRCVPILSSIHFGSSITLGPD